MQDAWPGRPLHERRWGRDQQVESGEQQEQGEVGEPATVVQQVGTRLRLGAAPRQAWTHAADGAYVVPITRLQVCPPLLTHAPAYITLKIYWIKLQLIISGQTLTSLREIRETVVTSYPAPPEARGGGREQPRECSSRRAAWRRWWEKPLLLELEADIIKMAGT